MKMEFFEEANLREPLHQLIRLRATGTPEQLADRLDIPLRNLERFIRKMKADGFPILYDRNRQCYYYENEVVFEIKFLVAEEVPMKKVVGGNFFRIFDDFFSPPPDFGGGAGFLCGR